MTIDQKSLDFRKLELLTIVHRERSFSRAAEILGLNQSVVSYSIEKLRQAFNDPLFVRESGRTLPTERCETIVAYAKDSLSTFESLQTPTEFDPRNATGRLVIACNFFERELIIPRIVARLRQQAPKLDIEIIDAADVGHEKLLSKEADFVIGPYQRSDASFYSRILFSDSYACLIDKNHPEAGKKLTLKRYLKFAHILITYGGRWTSPYITELEKNGTPINPVIRIPSPAGIAALVTGSDLVATIPEGPANYLKTNHIVLPCPVVSPIEIRLVWSASTHHSALSLWARSLIGNALKNWTAS